jgi:hypothetical protein
MSGISGVNFHAQLLEVLAVSIRCRGMTLRIRLSQKHDTNCRKLAPLPQFGLGKIA